jgi:serine/threonine protein kinase
LAWFSLGKAAPQAAIQAGDDDPALVAGRYQLHGRLGRGAGAAVHSATDLKTGASVAIKLLALPPGLPAAERQEWLNRLQKEAELARRLEHPHIVAVLATGLSADRAWLVMEKVNGLDLSRYTPRTRLLPEPLVLEIGAKVASALAHAHSLGIVHRDLKPANVLVNLGQGQVKLADFGVAKSPDPSQTQTGVTLGTPAYMAPELLIGEEASPASDAYALGVMLFELLTGRRPHEADTMGELLQAVARAAPARLDMLRPDLPRAAITAVEQLLAREPAARPADLGAWARQVAALAQLMQRAHQTPAA